ncbi:MAG: hypothetical protein NTZ94_14345, partial [Verrucomicrobia bacterium]|nr:hypothetical protein [Verrucomicrobiota bacterium]
MKSRITPSILAHLVAATPILTCQRLNCSAFLVFLAVGLFACSSKDPRAVENDASRVTAPQVESRRLVARTDQEVRAKSQSQPTPVL